MTIWRGSDISGSVSFCRSGVMYHPKINNQKTKNMSFRKKIIPIQHKKGRTFPRASKAPSKNSTTPKIINNPPNVVSATPISNHTHPRKQDLSINFSCNHRIPRKDNSLCASVSHIFKSSSNQGFSTQQHLNLNVEILGVGSNSWMGTQMFKPNEKLRNKAISTLLPRSYCRYTREGARISTATCRPDVMPGCQRVQSQ